MKISQKQIAIMVSAYSVIGLILALIAKLTIPAMNFFGVIYYALTWPLWLISGTFGLHFMPIADWMFSFQ